MPIEPIVYLVDDDPSVQRSLQRIITSAGWQVSIYASGAAFLEAYNPVQPGCLILDLRLPQMSGVMVQERLVAMGARLPIIFLTAFGELSIAVQAMRAGAFDFLEKPFSNQQLLLRVEQAIEQDAHHQLICQRRAEREARLARLTARERQVFDQVVTGAVSKEIAENLNIGVRTVEMHRQQIMRKLDARSVVDLVRLLLDDGYPTCSEPLSMSRVR